MVASNFIIIYIAIKMVFYFFFFCLYYIIIYVLADLPTWRRRPFLIFPLGHRRSPPARAVEADGEVSEGPEDVLVDAPMVELQEA